MGLELGERNSSHVDTMQGMEKEGGGTCKMRRGPRTELQWILLCHQVLRERAWLTSIQM